MSRHGVHSECSARTLRTEYGANHRQSIDC
nr:MAG TPA: hypothetical protein [Caudoviricetes sp.]